MVKEKKEEILENKIEKSVDMSLYNEESTKMKSNPHEYIMDWMEANLIHVGRRVFSLLALVPGSIILPNIPFGTSGIRSTINVFYISPPASGKSTTSKKFAKICYFPLQRRTISPADLRSRAISMRFLNLIIEDFSENVEEHGYDFIKALEGILGEEQNVSKSNMRTELMGDVKATGLLCGTPIDVEKYSKLIESGLLSRCCLLYITLTSEQHSQIGDYINSRIGNTEYSEKLGLQELVVEDYYKSLKEIQEGKNKDVHPVTGYSIPTDFKTKAGEVWKRISEELMVEFPQVHWTRDLQEFYRFLLSSAFLNIHHRKNDNGILVPNEEDFKLALRLMKQNMRYKWAIFKSTGLNKRIKSAEILNQVLNSNIPDSVKNILMNISPYSSLINKKNIFK